jgi:hypothetical protein
MIVVQLTDLHESEFPYNYFTGTKKECEIVEKVLKKYHEYDTNIEIEIVTINPTYKSLDDFFSVSEYKKTFEEIE